MSSKRPGRIETDTPPQPRRLAAFLHGQDGALLVFGLFIFTLMLMIGGLAVDLMRFEAERTRVQNTADRAALAAASMRQDLDPEEVVRDYFAKANLSDRLEDVDVDEGLNYRNVRAVTNTTTRPWFMPMMGIDELTTDSSGAAEERITNVEIALVLDVSGSMENTPSRIVNLRNAANEFITKLLEDDRENRVSISIVPYNGQVNIGPDLITKYNITDRHNFPNSHCVDLPPSTYNSVALPRTLPMPQAGHVDTYNNGVSTVSRYNTTGMAPLTTNRWCDPGTANRVRVHSNNLTQLRNQITGLQAIGATSIDAGLRWGLALLDPSARSVVSDLISENVVPAVFEGRPFDYDDPEVLKVIVLMTDGEHWPEERLNAGYRSGPSPIWRHRTENNYSIHHPGRSGTNKYWVPHRNEWRALPWGVTTTETCTGTIFNRVCTTTENWTNAIQKTWPEVWLELRLHWVAHQLYARAMGGTQASWVNTIRTRTGTVIGAGPHEVSAMDNRLNTLCGLAKARGVLIFGIAFEAPSEGVRVIRNCATPNRFYDVSGLEINTAFRQVRSQINQLRLTQ